MAINFTTGTINEPDAGSVGLSMVEKFRDDLVVHAAWELVEEFTAGSGLVRWYVFKCLAAQSGLSADFFVVVGRTLGSGELRFALCEGYDSGTHTMSKYCQAATTITAVAYDSSGRIPSSYTLSTAVWPNTTTTPTYNSWIPSGTSTKWWLIVTDDGFTVAFNGASNGYVHCGKYTSLSSLINNLPIHIFGVLGAGGAGDVGHLTRNPAVANVNHFGCALHTRHTASATSGPILGAMGDLQLADALQGGQRVVAEQGFSINLATGASTQYPITGWLMGKVNRMRINTTGAPVGFAFGDAYALQGRLWVPYLPTDGHMWDTGVAV